MTVCRPHSEPSQSKVAEVTFIPNRNGNVVPDNLGGILGTK